MALMDSLKGKKWPWIVGGLGVGGIAYLWIKNRQSQTGTSGSSTGMGAIDPNTGVPYSQEGIDPTTGVPYADEMSYGGGGFGGFGGGSSGTGSENITIKLQQQTAGHTSNASWAQGAEAYLTTLGYNPLSVAAALGQYLTGQCLSDDHYNIVEAAVGFEGNPPHSVRPPHRCKPHSGQGNGDGKKKPGEVTVPNVKNINYTLAAGKLVTVGLKPRRIGGPGTGIVESQNPDSGDRVRRGSTVQLRTRERHGGGK